MEAKEKRMSRCAGLTNNLPWVSRATIAMINEQRQSMILCICLGTLLVGLVAISPRGDLIDQMTLLVATGFYLVGFLNAIYVIQLQGKKEITEFAFFIEGQKSITPFENERGTSREEHGQQVDKEA